MLWSDLLLVVAVAGASGVGGASLWYWGVRRALRHLEHEVADLDGRLIREVKRRAAEARWSADDELAGKLDQLRTAYAGQGSTPAPASQPWWRKHGVQARPESEEANQERI